jgi:hypothetical protein
MNRCYDPKRLDHELVCCKYGDSMSPRKRRYPLTVIADIIILKYYDISITVYFRHTIYVVSQNEPEPPKFKFHLLSDCLSKWFIW